MFSQGNSVVRKCSKNPDLYKTELCRYWCAGLPCKFGSGCWFAHGPEELQIAQFVVPVFSQGVNSLDYEVRINPNSYSSMSSMFQELKLTPNPWDSGISSGQRSSDDLSASSSDKELHSPPLSSVSKSSCDSSRSSSPNAEEKKHSSDPKDLCDMYKWCGFCVMGNACPYSHLF
uniref:C3H1-type domain-containing protein n=1 Tax=Syphacia muris TaxID=451379 RepID=A0A0N5AHS7_9BILA